MRVRVAQGVGKEVVDGLGGAVLIGKYLGVVWRVDGDLFVGGVWLAACAVGGLV